MTQPDLIADCSRCADLCCVAFEFDQEQGFSLEKPINVPCVKLAVSGGCSIHAEREQHGMMGCAPYSCQGAGQYVSETLFPGQHWREDPALLPVMTDAMRELAVIHECLVLLQSAEEMDLPDYKREELEETRAMLCPDGGWSRDALSYQPSETLKAYAHAFLRSLTPWVT